MQDGLRERLPDPRDLTVGGAFSLPALGTLPLSYSIPSDYVYDQGNTDTCAGNATAKASGLQEGWKMDPLFTWMLARAQNDYKPDDWGIDLGSIGAAHVKAGALHLVDAPYKVTDDPAVWRDITNYNVPELLKRSIYGKKGSYVWVRPTDGLDMFDTIRATLWKFRSERVAVIIGIHWPYSSGVAKIDEWLPGGFGHAIAVTGWTTDNGKLYLEITNSWGKTAGQNGKFFLCRDVINKEVPAFGAFFFHDATPEQLRWAIDNGVKVEDNWLLAIIKALFAALTELRKKAAGIFRPTVTGCEVHTSKLDAWAHAIQDYEGYYPGSRSYRNCNPANARYCGQYTATGKDKDGFAIFPSYQVGFKYLTQILTNAATGKSIRYKPTMSLYDFYAIYAPSADHNDPRRYAEWIAKRIGVEPNSAIKNLL